MRNGQNKYPWDEWLDGQTRELRKGRDYETTLESFRAGAWRAADQRGKKVKTRIIRDARGEGLAIRAYEEGEEFDWQEADRSGHHLLYPWHEWLNGDTWELRRGQHFEVPAERLRRNAWLTARRKGKKVRTRLVRDDAGEGLVVRAFEDGEELDWEEADRPGPVAIYPWEQWLNGEAWELQQGTDYLTPTERFRKTAWSAAHSQGKKIETRLVRDGSAERLVIRAYEA
jgi:hypothetical protein